MARLHPAMETLVVEVLSDPVPPPVPSAKRLVPAVKRELQRQGKPLDPAEVQRLATLGHDVMVTLVTAHRACWKDASA